MAVVFVFVNEEDRRIFKELVLVLKTAGAPIPREIANSRYTTSVCVGRERKRKLSSSF
jgi:ATP-dependent RNA helicase DDX59